jgi:hypothetical protein
VNDAAHGLCVTELELAAALRPLLDRVGGRLLGAADADPTDSAVLAVELPRGPTVWVRLPDAPSGPAPSVDDSAARPAADLSDGLARLIGTVERELGGHLAELPRAEKQRAVRLLEERGAFEMRRSAEVVAEALGVTRFTVYNYLNRRSTA